jgi:tRNA threonylcarbamoyladenosine biosynthesis protein TsaE
MQPGTVFLPDATATAALGRQLGQAWSEGATPVLLLEGDLGAGKTCLVQGLAEGLGIAEPITSPTFALAQHYSGRQGARATALIHLDLYRLELPAAADELFAQEEEEAAALGALMAVEWASRLSFRPEQAWTIHLALANPEQPEAGRIATLSQDSTSP